jgi:hypothetical protein
MTESKLVELGFSEVTPGFWVGSVFAIQRLVEVVKEEARNEEAKRNRCAEQDGVV